VAGVVSAPSGAFPPDAPGAGDFAIGSRVWPGVSKVLEEMGELAQVLGKLIAVAGSTSHWDGDLRGRVIEEAADVLAAVRFFAELNLDSQELRAFNVRVFAKIQKFHDWHRRPQAPKPDPEPIETPLPPAPSDDG